MAGKAIGWNLLVVVPELPAIRNQHYSAWPCCCNRLRAGLTWAAFHPPTCVQAAAFFIEHRDALIQFGAKIPTSGKVANPNQAPAPALVPILAIALAPALAPILAITLAPAVGRFQFPRQGTQLTQIQALAYPCTYFAGTLRAYWWSYRYN